MWRTFARYQQAQFETTYSSYLGDNFWGKEVTDGKTYEENYKDSIMDSLEEMYVLDEHKDDYKVSLSDDEEKASRMLRRNLLTAMTVLQKIQYRAMKRR